MQSEILMKENPQKKIHISLCSILNSAYSYEFGWIFEGADFRVKQAS
jgi:hypothetical protein